jgi:hypothetical protein
MTVDAFAAQERLLRNDCEVTTAKGRIACVQSFDRILSAYWLQC